MGDAIAHVLVSFAFKDAPPLAVSIETRKEVGEPYSTLLGFFRRYELVYVVADERDLIGVRTNVRADPPEDVYLYRVRAPPAAVRRLFLEYLHQMNELREQPEFYNTATTNCTTMVLINNRVNGAVSLLNWKILLSGYMPQLVYERGGLDQTCPSRSCAGVRAINDAARAAGIDVARLLGTDPHRPAEFPALDGACQPASRACMTVAVGAGGGGGSMPWTIDDLDTPVGADRPRPGRGQPAPRPGLCRRARPASCARTSRPTRSPTSPAGRWRWARSASPARSWARPR